MVNLNNAATAQPPKPLICPSTDMMYSFNLPGVKRTKLVDLSTRPEDPEC